MPTLSSLEDKFTRQLIDEQITVTLFLINGVKLKGVITHADNGSLILRRDGHGQLIYRHAVSTILPDVRVDLFDTGAM
jgi:host factor-I protein